MKKSLRKAINAKCKDCIFDPLARGSELAQITLCSVKTCPLHEVRRKTKTIGKVTLAYYGLDSVPLD